MSARCDVSFQCQIEVVVLVFVCCLKGLEGIMMLGKGYSSMREQYNLCSLVRYCLLDQLLDQWLILHAFVLCLLFYLGYSQLSL
jgi:hypothetical protein